MPRVLMAKIAQVHAGGMTNGFRTHGRWPTGPMDCVLKMSCCYLFLLCLLSPLPS
uniref:Uncharacterized protein n=1 Tax=Trichinella nativa TaxID=6335 RepID=A0A0V1KJL6_9BILA